MRARYQIPFALWMAVTFMVGEVQGQASEAADRIAGCYVLRIGTWTRTIGDEVTYYTPPDTIQLHADYRVTPTLRYSGNATRRAQATWRIAAADSVVLSWTNGFAVARLSLSSRGPVFRGTLRAISDAHPIPAPPPRTAPVEAHRITCRGASVDAPAT
jgi:hypothetical protein